MTTVNDLLDILILEEIGEHQFKGLSKTVGSPTVFGGQVLAQAINAAARTIKNNRISSQYNDMRGDFAFARDLAITRNFAVTLSSNNGNDWSNGWSVVSPTGVARVSFANNVAINASVASITYRSDGTANVTASTAFKICDDRTGSYGNQMNVNFAGRVNLTKGVSCP